MKFYVCKHCKNEFTNLEAPTSFMSNHTRWCHKNPKRVEYVERLKNQQNIKLMNDARKKTGRTNQFTTARLDGTPIPVSSLKGKPKTKVYLHTKQTIEKIRLSALLSKHRRLKKNTILYNGILLDSSWELSLAKRLDELSIEWTRPKPLPWTDSSGKIHNYFPDFYLPKYDLFLDPKNDFASKVQAEKLTILLKTYKNILIIPNRILCETFTIDWALSSIG